MFEFITIAIFIWLMVKVIGLSLKLTWGIARVIASALLVIAVPLLFVCLMFVGGIVVIVPLALLGIAFGIVKACV